MIAQLLHERNLPPVVLPGMGKEDWPARREAMLSALARSEYGVSPAAPEWVRAETLQEQQDMFGGKALHRRVLLTFPTPAGEFSFPVDLALPHGGPKPLVVHIGFLPYPDGLLTPVEEILDHGCGLALFCCNDVTDDRDDGFSSGLAGQYPRVGSEDWGKLAMWAWAASRVLDHVLTLPEVDATRVAVAGQSRLGKAALWCAAMDERFATAFINESGCSGAAISRGKSGETVKHITTAFPHWFCANYAGYGGREGEMPFDQHWLLAAMAPRPVAVASAEQDLWSDPESEFLCCAAASPAWELLGLPGFVCDDRLPKPGDVFHGGAVGYHMRAGTHFFSRQDWQLFLGFLNGKPG